MLPFRHYMIESKNTHLEHVEDWVLNAGYEGGSDAISVLDEIVTNLSGGSVVVTTKWDGSLALFAGIDPASKKFFVGTKAVLSKNPKLNFTNQDIDRHHAGNPALQDILKIALTHVRKLGIRNVLQGDVIFVRRWMKVKQIDGEEMLLFKPNTVVYGVPSKSDLAQDIMNSHIGVVWHTSYSGGKTVPEMKAKLNPNIRSLNRVKEVWFDDATIKNASKIVQFTKAEQSKIKSYLGVAASSLRSAGDFANELASNTVSNHLKTFDNSLIKSGRRLDSKAVDELVEFLDQKYKSQAGKDRSIGLLKTNKSKFLAILKHRQAVDKAKMVILKRLERIGSFAAFVETPDGYKVGAQEGFVALSSKSGKVVKLVDRLTFSRLNFTGH